MSHEGPTEQTSDEVGYGDVAASQPNTIRPGGGRKWIHAATVKGSWQRRRNVTALVLLLCFYAVPWLTIEGRPLVRLSFLDDVFFLLGQPILIYEFYHFVLLALLLVLTLFLASALFGRIWCGWACPQTIFIEHILMRIETLVEGPAAHRIALEGKPWTGAVAVKNIVKQVLFLVVSLSFAATLVALFVGPLRLLAGHQSSWVAVFLLTGLAWFDGAWWREQFCHIVCPYARFQSVMQDAATRTVGYDLARGEPRGRGKNRDGKGSCIDCGLCTRVCPSGIDIRQGASQLECTGCTRCIDACDGIMKSIRQPTGLIRFDSVAFFEKSSGKSPPILRPRILAYAAGWIALTGIGIWLFLAREPFHVKQIATGHAKPYILAGDQVQNLFNLKIANQSGSEESYTLRLTEGTAGLQIASPVTTGRAKPGQELTIPVLLVGAIADAGAKVKISVTAAGSQMTRIVERTFAGPTRTGTPGQIPPNGGAP
jgi:cytochrome c oxidase accessory protein FixG